MRIPSWIPAFPLALATVVGCSDADKRVEARRRHDIAVIEENHLPNKNPVQQDRWLAILAALRASTTETLKTPSIAHATWWQKSNDCLLLVYWLEAWPSVDGLEFQSTSNAAVVFLPISEETRKANELEAKEIVLFSIAYTCQYDKELSELRKAIETPDSLKVRLTRTNAPVTAWFPVTHSRKGFVTPSR
jgi:hypothetical protein